MLVRVHSECLTGDVFHSLRCDCGEQLAQALGQLADEEHGVLLYMAQEGRGIGLLNKLQGVRAPGAGLDTVEANLELGFPADAREYGIGNQILADLGLTTIRILTNNPKKLTGIEGFGLTVVEQVPIEVAPNDENRRYLETKRDKLGHRLHHQDLRFAEGKKDERAMSEIESRLRELGAAQPAGSRLSPKANQRGGFGEPGALPRQARSPLRSRAPGEPGRTRLRRAPLQHTPGELRVPDGYSVLAGAERGSPLSRRSSSSRFNGEITNRLLERALDGAGTRSALRAMR